MRKMINAIVVDDENRLRRGIEKLILKNGEEWSIVGSYGTGQECFDDVVKRKIEFDVIFTDVKMPVMSGLELLTRLNEQNIRDYHAIVISGYDDFKFIQKAMREGAIDYLLKPIDRKEMQSCLDKLKIRIIKNDMPDTPVSPTVPISIAVQWIDEHLSEHISIDQIAAVVFMNPSYLSAYFKKKMGETVLDYITRKRLEKAAHLLKTTNLKIYEIVNVVGYSDTKYFTKIFKRKYNMLPSQMRNGQVVKGTIVSE